MYGHEERKLVNFCTFDMHCAWPCVQRKVNKTKKEKRRCKVLVDIETKETKEKVDKKTTG